MKALALLLLSTSALLVGCSHPQPVAYGPPPPRIPYAEIHDRGIHDGYNAARNDVSRNHPPSFDHHPLYRNPPVPGPAVRDYREGFRQGYEQFLHEAPPPRSY